MPPTEADCEAARLLWQRINEIRGVQDMTPRAIEGAIIEAIAEAIAAGRRR